MLDVNMERLKNGDIDALDSIYEETRKLVFSVCLSYVHDYMLAEDMMQDTYINVRKYIDKYSKNTNPQAWIVTIAKNRCLNELKVRKRVDYGEEVYKVVDNHKEKKESTPLLDLALKLLNSKELLILLPHIIDDKKLIDIAHDLNLSEGTVRWRYNNALNKLRKYIERSNKNGTNK